MIKELLEKRKAYKEDLAERCVLCHEITEYTQNTHIDLRKHYVEGVGQLCEDCYRKLKFHHK